MYLMKPKDIVRRDFQYREYVGLLDISLTEYFVLLELAKEKEPVPRKLVMDILNKKFYDPKAIHPSSYYKRLDRLEKKGLIRYVDTSSPRNQTIEITPFGEKFLTDMFFFSLLGLINFDEITPQLMQAIIPRLERSHFGQILVVNMEIGITSKTINMISSLADQTFLLADPYDFELSIKSGLSPNILRSDFLDGHIREANDVFDAVVVIGYDSNFGMYYEQDTKMVLNEAIRVLAKGGVFLVVTNEAIPDIDNIVIQAIRKSIEHTNAMGNETIENVMKNLKSYQLERIDAISHGGIIVAWGYKPLAK